LGGNPESFLKELDSGLQPTGMTFLKRYFRQQFSVKLKSSEIAALRNDRIHFAQSVIARSLYSEAISPFFAEDCWYFRVSDELNTILLMQRSG